MPAEVGSVGGMVRRWAPAAVVLGLLAGCGFSTAGRGTPGAGPARATSMPPGLPVPAEPTETSVAPSPAPPASTVPRTTASPATPAARPCPADVARTLPGSPPATLVAGFTTARFRLYFCRTADGRLFYRGVSRADAAQATTLPARTVPGGYEARTVFEGSAYVYRVVQRRLVVTRDGKRILAEAATATR